MADFTATFMRNSASKIQLMYLVSSLGPDQLEELTSYNTELQNLYSGSRVIKVLDNVGNTLTHLQMLACELRLNVFGGRLCPDPLGKLLCSP